MIPAIWRRANPNNDTTKETKRAANTDDERGNAAQVLVWSAASASCALPLLFEGVELVAKNAKGDMVPYNLTNVKWTDGSLHTDLPINQVRGGRGRRKRDEEGGCCCGGGGGKEEGGRRRKEDAMLEMRG